MIVTIKAKELMQGMEIVERDGGLLTVDSIKPATIRRRIDMTMQPAVKVTMSTLNQRGITATVGVNSLVNVFK